MTRVPDRDDPKGGDRKTDTRPISVSAAPYDGYELAETLDSLAALGVRHLEPAFIAGYTDPFDETAFAAKEAYRYRRQVEAAGLSCICMSSHIDLGGTDAAQVFAGRMAFAAGIGAGIIATNAAARVDTDRFFRNMETLLPAAEDAGVIIALENPGNGEDNIFNLAADGIDLVRRFDSPFLRLNYDAANTASHQPALGDFAGDAIRALPASAHAHIKDLNSASDGWHFTAIGDGTIGCGRILDALAGYPDLPISIELPLRFHRGPNALPVRRSERVPLAEIESAVSRSLRFVRQRLAGAPVETRKLT